VWRNVCHPTSDPIWAASAAGLICLANILLHPQREFSSHVSAGEHPIVIPSELRGPFPTIQDIGECGIQRQSALRVPRFDVSYHGVHDCPLHEHGKLMPVEVRPFQGEQLLYLKPVLRATITAVRQGSTSFGMSAWIS
jgi:hypothetical protein